MFEGQVDSAKRINLIYKDVERHYHVIVNLTGPRRDGKFVRHVTQGVGETYTRV